MGMYQIMETGGGGDFKYKGRIIPVTSFGDTSVADELTLHRRGFVLCTVQ